MAAGDSREALLRVADRLSSELGYPEGDDPPGASSFVGEVNEGQVGILSAEDERLVAGLTRALERMARVLGAPEQDDGSQKLVSAALDGAEMTMRGELMRGRSEHLAALMPSFVFLVALPIVDQDEAFKLSRRTFELFEDVGPDI